MHKQGTAALAGCHWLIVVAALFTGVGAARAEAVTIGAEDDAGPWSYADGTAYVNDAVRAAFHAVGWTVELKVIPYARCKALATSGKLAGCFSASRTPELEGVLQSPRRTRTPN